MAEWYGAGLLLVYAVVLFAHSIPPSMTDYANWTYQGVLLSRHARGLPDPTHALKLYPVPNSAASIGVGLFTLLLPWQVAAKLWLCVQLLISYIALRHLARTTDASAALWFIVPQALFLAVNWWYGFVNFELGLVWVLLTASMLLRRARGERRRDWTIGLVLVLAFFTHMIPFAFCGLLVLLYANQTKHWRINWQLLPSVLLGVWYMAGRYLIAGNADGQAGMVSLVKNYSADFWAYKVNSYMKSFGFVNPEGQGASIALHLLGRPLFILLFLANILLCILLGWRIIQVCRIAYRDQLAERFLWTGVGVLVPIYLLAPGTALGVSDPGSRVLQAALALALVLACRSMEKLLAVASVCATALTLAGLFLFARSAFRPEMTPAIDQGVPHVVVLFNHVPNHDQDYFYDDLKRSDYDDLVFPTGMLLNRASAKSPMPPG